jgi:hypothetical protein
MEKENEIGIIAYALWAQDGYNRRSAVRHWLRAEAIWEQNRRDQPALSRFKVGTLERVLPAEDTALMMLPGPG